MHIVSILKKESVKHVGLISWSILLISFVFLQIQIYLNFNGVYVDGDQTISWLSAVDKANGNWYTSYFYGQFYNISLEAIFSAPFIAMGFPVHKVVPITSSIIGALPFLLGSFYFLKKRQYELANLVLCIGLILPVQYHFMTVMSRGFSGGLALLSIGFFLLSFRKYALQYLGFTLMFFSYFVNPNVLIVLVPLITFKLLSNIFEKKTFDKRFYVIAILGILSALGLLQIVNLQNHPNYVVHHLWDIVIRWEYFVENVQTIDSRFSNLFPFFKKHGSLYIAVFVLTTGYYVVKKNQKAWLLSLSTLCFLLVTLAVNKTTDGTLSTFYPYSRMYLGLPFLLILVYHVLFEKKSDNTKRLLVIAFVGLIGGTFSIIGVPEQSKVTVRKNSGVVQVIPIDRLCKTCDDIEKLQQKTDADLVVFYYKTDEFIYGCSALNNEFNAIYPEYDRRYWTFKEFGLTPYRTILFLDWSVTLDKKLIQYNGELTKLEGVHFPAYLLRNNTQSVVDLFEQNNLTVRPY